MAPHPASAAPPTGSKGNQLVSMDVADLVVRDEQADVDEHHRQGTPCFPIG